MRHLLSQAETYQLLKWLDTPEIRAFAMENPDDMTAGFAGQTLKLKLSPRNITQARKTLGIEKRKAKAAGGPQSADLSAMESLIADLEGKVSTLKHNVQNLLDRVRNLEQKPRH